MNFFVRLIDVVIYGASSMIKHNMVLTTYVWNDQPSSMNVYCIIHMWMVEKYLIINMIKSLCSGLNLFWFKLGGSFWIINNWCLLCLEKFRMVWKGALGDFAFSCDAMVIKKLRYGIILRCVPTLLEAFQHEKPYWYFKLTSYQF